MLKITIPSIELYDEENRKLIDTKPYALVLEHSLVSISKWESKWCKPFLSNENRSREELIDYIRCMTITQNVDPDVYNYITAKTLDQISEYIDAPMTATTFGGKNKKTSREIITSELIYYWMTAFQINWEAERWHLARLLVLINICSIKNQPKKKKSRAEIVAEQRALNEKRKAAYNTKG